MIQQPTLNPSQPDPEQATERDPMLGRCLAGRYIVRELIGEGAMGRVFVAEQLSVGRNVAIKVMKSELFQDPGLAGRFKLEMEIISSLQHPSIVRLLDTGHDLDLDVHFIVMEYVEGISLGDLLYDREVEGALTPEIAIEIVIQLCSALTEPHQLGVIHRDIKPDNIILTVQSDEQLAIKLLDFGVARVVDPHEKIDSAAARARLTATGGIVGTPPYIAPELCEGSSRASHRSDLYAIGAMLFELLTGRAPFEGRSTAELLFKHVHEPAPRLREHIALRPCVGEALEVLILDLLEKAPEDRPVSALEVKKRLEDIVIGSALEPPVLTLHPSGSTYQTIAPFIVAVERPRPDARTASLKATRQSEPATKTLEGNPILIMAPRETLPPASTHAPVPETGRSQEPLLTSPERAQAEPAPLRTRGNASEHTGIFLLDRLSSRDSSFRPSTTSVAASFGLGVMLLAIILSYTTQDSSAQPLAMLPLSTQHVTSASLESANDHGRQSQALLDSLKPARRTPSIAQASSTIHGALSRTTDHLDRPTSHAQQAAASLHGRARALSLDLSESREATLTQIDTSPSPTSRKARTRRASTKKAQPERLDRIQKKIDWLYQR